MNNLAQFFSQIIYHRKRLLVATIIITFFSTMVFAFFKTYPINAAYSQEKALQQARQDFDNKTHSQEFYQATEAANPSIQEMAAYTNSLGNTYKIPSVILKAVMYQESSWRQFNADGSPVISPDGGIGIMQVTFPLPHPSVGTKTLGRIIAGSQGPNPFTIVTEPVQIDINRLKTDWQYNLEIGARILLTKKVESASQEDDASLLENWWYTLAYYNGFKIGGANDPANTKYSRNVLSSNDWRSVNVFPYQECIFNIVAQLYPSLPSDIKLHMGTPIKATLPGPSKVGSGSGKYNWVAELFKGGDTYTFYKDNRAAVNGITYQNQYTISHQVNFSDVEVSTPTTILSPVEGSLRVTSSNIGTGDGKWEFNQHKSGGHRPGGGIGGADDTNAWDCNLYEVSNRNGDVGKSVYAVAEGDVVTYAGVGLTNGCNAVLIAHPNKNNPIWWSGYLHLGAQSVSLNQHVTQDTVIGTVGRACADNDHLHFAVYTGENSSGKLKSFNVNITERAACGGGASVGYKVNHPNGTLIIGPNGGAIYLIQNGQKREIASQEILNNLYQNGGFGFKHAIKVSLDELNSYPQGSDVFNTLPSNGKAHPEGRLIEYGGQISIVSDGVRRPFDDGKTFTGLGYLFCNAVSVSATAYNSYTVGAIVTGQPTTPSYSLGVSVIGSGTVTSSPTGINCSSGTCSANFNSGTQVTLAAMAASGWSFNGWSGACSGTGTCTVTMNSAKSVTATFTPQPQSYTVSVSVNGSGTVTSSPSGINCSSGTCSATFASGTNITLSASASSGWAFNGWSGACSGQNCGFTLTSDRSVTASFTQQQQTYPLTVSVNGNGTVNSSPPGINCPINCSSNFNKDAVVTLTASAGSGSIFTGWDSPCSGKGTCSVTMNAAKSITAYFAQTRTLTVESSNPSSGVTIFVGQVDNTGQGNGITPFIRNHNHNLTVNLSAPATAGGNNFQKWTRNGTDYSTNLAISFPMDNNYTVTAVYSAAPPPACSASRTLPGGYAPGQTFQVTIQTTSPAGTSFQVIEDKPPQGWAIQNIDNDGSYDPNSGKVKWFFSDATSRSLHYFVTPPTGASGVQTFVGSYILDEKAHQICGISDISPLTFHPADTNNDLRIVAVEIASYGTAWKKGTAWPRPPSPIPASYIANAGVIWKKGETYHYDSSKTPPWSQGAALQSTSAFTLNTVNQALAVPEATGAATSSFSQPTYAPGTDLTVSIDVIPDSSTEIVVVEDTVPPGWAVSSISNDGDFDASARKVKWLLLNNKPTILTYKVTPPIGETGAKSFTGIAIFDETQIPITGQRTITSGTVGPIPTSTSLISSTNPSTYGQQVTFTASVIKQFGSGTPTGSLTFKDGVLVLGMKSLDATGSATITISSLSAGQHSITAEYGGDSNFNGSSSMPVTQTITKSLLTVTADNKSKIVGAPLPQFTYKITGFVNGDTEAVVSGIPNITTTATVDSPAGTYPIIIALGTLNATNYSFTFVNATLTVNPPTVTITTHPASQSICAGNPVTFSVAATGDTALTYQWRKNQTPITNATSSSFTINSVTAGDAGTYDVIVSGVQSNAATLTVNTAPTVTTHPAIQSATVGSTATFTAAANGTPAPSVQWQVSTDGGANFTNIPGATSTTLMVSSLVQSDNGKRYRAVFTNSCGSVPTNAATLSVSEALTITKHPSTQTLCTGQAATFSVTATGANLSYQWQKNGVPIQGAIASTYNIPSVSTTDSGNYAVVVTSGASSITSNSAVLTVNAATAITVQPLGQSKIVGQSVTFSVTAAGTNLTYQWRKNGSPINAATNSSFTIPSVSLSDEADYDVIVSGSCGATSSNVAKLTVTCPTITVTPTTLSMGTVGVVYSQSFSQTGGKGNVTFDLTGTLPSGLSFSGNTLAGTPSQVGSFSIIVKATDENRCMGSRAYPLVIVTPPPTITSLGPTSKFAGDSAFTLTVNGKDFVNGAKVLWNGSERATTFVDSTKLTAMIPGSDIASVANVEVTVVNPSPGNGTSNAVAFTILLGYEADVAPAGMVDGRVTIADWVKIGGIYIGNDTVAACSSELQRADCFPKETRGDGKISIGDWVQAGRYAAGLDPMVPAGGTLGCATLPSLSLGYASFASELTRTVRVKNANFVRGQIGTLEIELDAQGNENATAFTLQFDPKLMSFVTAKLGEGTNNAFLQINTSQAASGRIGLAIMLPAGQQLAAGTSSLLTLRFIPNGGDGDVVTNISFSDQLLAREVVDALASPIPQVSYVGGAITIRGRAAASVSAASYVTTGLAADSIASAFGTKLAMMTVAAATSPLPNTLGGTSVKVTDAQGIERSAPLFFVSPTQLNYQIPQGTAEGIATVTITNGAGEVTLGLLNIGKVAPGLFSADSSGKGWAAADVVYVKPDQSQVIRQVARFDVGQNRFVPVPIDLSTDAAVLVLYGTGVRHRTGLANVKVKIDGVEAAVEYADRQGQFAGLDQINVRLPKSLAGRGEVNVEVSVEGKPANPIRIMLQ